MNSTNSTEEIKKKLLEKKEKPHLNYKNGLSTGSTLLNLACTGRSDVGFLPGAYYFFVGDSASGKTFITLTCMAEASINPKYDNYKFIYDNVEGGAKMDIVKFFGKKTVKKLIDPPFTEGPSNTIEDFYYNLDEAANDHAPFIYVLDSMDSLSSSEEIEKFEEKKKAAQLARAKAELLLVQHLSPKQREDLLAKDCFYIEIPHENGKVERYRIDRGSHGNVKQLDDAGRILRSFCVQPPDCPDGDSMLAQKLYLESSEETRRTFWEIANITEMGPEAKRLPFHVPRAQRRVHALQNNLLLH
jgi:hypothetical protein